MKILCVDDDPEDISMYGEAISYLNESEDIDKQEKLELVSLNDSRKLLSFLTSSASLPDYIFLDINMPILRGKECLSLLKSHPEFSRIPVVMFSTTCDAYMSRELKKLGAVDCIQKPGEFNKLVKIFSRFIFQRH